MMGGRLFLSTLEHGLSRTLSDMEKMKEVTSVEVGDWRKRAWSAALRMRREGWMYVWFWRGGGEGSGGVGGGGAEGASRCTGARLRGVSLGRALDRSGGGCMGVEVVVMLAVVCW